MGVQKVIWAAQAPEREGLELGVTRLEGTGDPRMLLTAGRGAAVLELGPQEGFFVFAHGKARLLAVSDPAERAFVDAIAEWLGLELEQDGSGVSRDCGGETLQCSWVRLGVADAFGVRWDAFKFFLTLGERHAEVFFRLAEGGARAQLVEKWSKYRSDLVDILERALTESAPRRSKPHSPAEPASSDKGWFGLHGTVRFHIPDGWRLTHRPEGHWRIADADDEMMVELWATRLRPLRPDAPDVVGRLRALIQGSEYPATASPPASFEPAPPQVPKLALRR